MRTPRTLLSLAVLAALSGCSKGDSSPAPQAPAAPMVAETTPVAADTTPASPGAVKSGLQVQDHVGPATARPSKAKRKAKNHARARLHTLSAPEMMQAPLANPNQAEELSLSLVTDGQASVRTNVQKAKDLAARTKALLESSAKATVQNNLRLGNAVDYTTRTLFLEGLSRLTNESIRIGKELNELGYRLRDSLVAEVLPVQEELNIRAQALAQQTAELSDEIDQLSDQIDTAIRTESLAFDARANEIYLDARNFVVTESNKFITIWTKIGRQAKANAEQFLGDLADGFDQAVYAAVDQTKTGLKALDAFGRRVDSAVEKGVLAASDSIGTFTTKTIDVLAAPADAPTYPRARLGNLARKAPVVAAPAKGALEVVADAAAGLREKEFNLMLGADTDAEKSVHALLYLGAVHAQLASPAALSSDAGEANVAKRAVVEEFLGRVRALPVGGADFRAVVEAFGPAMPGDGSVVKLLKESLAAGEAVAAGRASRDDYPSYVDVVLSDEETAKALVGAYDAIAGRFKI